MLADVKSLFNRRVAEARRNESKKISATLCFSASFYSMQRRKNDYIYLSASPRLCGSFFIAKVHRSQSY
jgi:hypothetical protein